MIDPPPIWWRALWPLRVAAVPLYWIGLQSHRAAYQVGVGRRYRPPVPVICVGNLSVGGTGKTAVVISIARMLQAAGRKVAVLTRGYKSRAARRSVSSLSGRSGRARVSPFDVGDEPFLLTEKLNGVDVLVGADRAASARAAVEQLRCDVLVMDDGFQHWALERDLDIVLLDAAMPRSLEHLLPWGAMRETFAALKRADVAIVAKAASREQRQRTADRVRRTSPAIHLWQADISPRRDYRLADGKTIARSSLAGRPVVLVCALASPANFERTALALGCRIEKRFFYRDHFVYPDLVVRYLELQARRSAAQWLLTTEKDAVKLRGRTDPQAPWAVVAVEIDWLEPPAEKVRAFLEERLSRSKPGKVKG